MKCDLHHVHLFASDLDASLRFYRQMFGAEILFDETVAGVRNVMIRIGTGRINFYISRPAGPVPARCITSAFIPGILREWSPTWRRKDLNSGTRSGILEISSTSCWKDRITC